MDHALPLTVRLEVGGMKHQILHAFVQREAETMSVLQQQLEYVLSEENIAAVVQQEAATILREELRKALTNAVYRALGDTEVRQQLDYLTTKALLAVLKVTE